MFDLANFDFKELKKRVLTSFFGLLFLGGFHYFIRDHDYELYMIFGQLIYNVFMIILYSEMLIVVYTSSAKLYKKITIFTVGLFYMGVGSAGLLNSVLFDYFIYLLGSVFLMDTVGYFVGKFFQGPLLVPSISPNKTVSGFFASLICGIFAFYFFLLGDITTDNILLDILFSFGFAFSVLLGDLLVSFAKRVLGIKDASKLLPGHGGFWDRFDSVGGSAFFVFVLRMIFCGDLEMYS